MPLTEHAERKKRESREQRQRNNQQELLLDDTIDVPLILIAHDLSPADMLQFKQRVCRFPPPMWVAKHRTPPSWRAA